MDAVQEATLTIGEAARRLQMTVDGVLQRIYDGHLPATPEPRTGRLLLHAQDVERLREQQGAS